jgi:hypothetical protein
MSDKELEGEAREQLTGEISRREWLLKLGEAAFVFGFGGSAVEPGAKVGAALSLAAQNLRALPPGLYDPSSEHMAQVLTRDELYLKIPPGTETDYVRPRQGPFRPLFFDEREFQAIQRLVKLILGSPPKGSSGTGDIELAPTIVDIAEWIDLVVSQAAAVREAALQISPQHRALAVAYYGREEVERLETEDSQRVYRDGLSWFDERSRELHGVPFLEASELSQIEVARLAADASSRRDRESAGAKFLSYLSSQTIRGWYTSRIGLHELGYKGNSFSVQCPGCKTS